MTTKLTPPIRFCAWLPCFKHFTPTRASQEYCCHAHQRRAACQAYYYKVTRVRRLKKREALAIALSPNPPTRPRYTRKRRLKGGIYATNAPTRPHHN